MLLLLYLDVYLYLWPKESLSNVQDNNCVFYFPGEGSATWSYRGVTFIQFFGVRFSTAE